eukprot:jgi/Mesvir1/12554/Mv21758-RA.1
MVNAAARHMAIDTGSIRRRLVGARGQPPHAVDLDRTKPLAEPILSKDEPGYLTPDSMVVFRFVHSVSLPGVRVRDLHGFHGDFVYVHGGAGDLDPFRADYEATRVSQLHPRSKNGEHPATRPEEPSAPLVDVGPHAGSIVPVQPRALQPAASPPIPNHTPVSSKAFVPATVAHELSKAYIANMNPVSWASDALSGFGLFPNRVSAPVTHLADKMNEFGANHGVFGSAASSVLHGDSWKCGLLRVATVGNASC